MSAARGFAILVLLALVGAVSLAGKGGNGKPPKDDPPADPAIAYILDRDLYVMDADASNQTRIVRRSMADNVAWSPDGAQLAITNDTYGWGVHIVDVDGGNLHRIVALDENRLGSKGLSWSPVATADGEYKIAFTDWGSGGLRDVFVVNPDGTGLQNLTSTSDIDEWSPTWSPDARRLAAAEQPHSGGTGEIVVYDVGSDGSGGLALSNPLYLTEDADVPDGPLNDVGVRTPAWANTQDAIAVQSQNDIWIIPLDDPASAYNLTSSSVFEGWPSWSPDDSEILYASDAGEDLYVIDVSTGESTLLHESGRRNGRGHAWRRNQ